jgi:hypothetical protein
VGAFWELELGVWEGYWAILFPIFLRYYVCYYEASTEMSLTSLCVCAISTSSMSLVLFRSVR